MVRTTYKNAMGHSFFASEQNCKLSNLDGTSHLPVAPSAVHAVVPQVVVGRQDGQAGVEGRPRVPVHVLHDQPRPGDQEPVADAEGAAGGGGVAGGEATLLPGSADIPRKKHHFSASVFQS